MNTPERHAKFLAFIEGHKGILYKVCKSYCPTRDDRDDLAQEMIVQLWRSFGSFDERHRFSTWMYRICLNVAISFHLRESTRRRHVLSADQRVLDAVDESESPSEDIVLLYQFIDRLDALNKALVLLYLDGNSYREIAEVLGISATNVATKISRLKKSVKRELCEQTEA
jgi:RNA polymerase sigma-70 factor (ECF subfamily)